MFMEYAGVTSVKLLILSKTTISNALHECLITSSILMYFSIAGQARIRVQMSAAHSVEEVEKCIAAFVEVGKRKGIIG